MQNCSFLHLSVHNNRAARCNAAGNVTENISQTSHVDLLNAMPIPSSQFSCSLVPSVRDFNYLARKTELESAKQIEIFPATRSKS